MSFSNSVNWVDRVQVFDHLLFSCPEENCTQKSDQLNNIFSHINFCLNGGKGRNPSETVRNAHIAMIEHRLRGSVYRLNSTKNKYELNKSNPYLRNQFSEYCKMKSLCEIISHSFDFDFILREFKSNYKCPWCEFVSPNLENVKLHILRITNSKSDSKNGRKEHFEKVNKCFAFHKLKGEIVFKKGMEQPFLKFCREMHMRSELKEPLYHPPFLSLFHLFPDLMEQDLHPNSSDHDDQEPFLCQSLELSGISNDPGCDLLAQDLFLNSDHRFQNPSHLSQGLIEEFSFEEFNSQKIEEQPAEEVFKANKNSALSEDEDYKEDSTKRVTTSLKPQNPKRRCLRGKRT